MLGDVNKLASVRGAMDKLSAGDVQCNCTDEGTY